jgi:hypothetical protein
MHAYMQSHIYRGMLDNRGKGRAGDFSGGHAWKHRSVARARRAYLRAMRHARTSEEVGRVVHLLPSRLNRGQVVTEMARDDERKIPQKDKLLYFDLYFYAFL